MNLRQTRSCLSTAGWLAGREVSGQPLLLVPATSKITYKQLFVDNRHHLATRPLLSGGSWGPLPLTVSGGPLRWGVLLLALPHGDHSSQRTSQCMLPMSAEQNQANTEKPNRLHLLINDSLPIHKLAVFGRLKTKPCALAFYFSNNAIACCACYLLIATGKTERTEKAGRKQLQLNQIWYKDFFSMKQEWSCALTELDSEV